MQQPGKGYQDPPLRQYGCSTGLSRFALYSSLFSIAAKIHLLGMEQADCSRNKDVATWKAAPREASREAVEALESYIHEHTTMTGGEFFLS